MQDNVNVVVHLVWCWGGSNIYVEERYYLDHRHENNCGVPQQQIRFVIGMANGG